MRFSYLDLSNDAPIKHFRLPFNRHLVSRETNLDHIRALLYSCEGRESSNVTYYLQKGGDPSPASARDTLLRLKLHRQFHLPPINRSSGAPDFAALTGGVYKTRERIHRGTLIRDY